MPVCMCERVSLEITQKWLTNVGFFVFKDSVCYIPQGIFCDEELTLTLKNTSDI